MEDGRIGLIMGIVASPVEMDHEQGPENAIHLCHPTEDQVVLEKPQKRLNARKLHVPVCIP